MLQLRALKNKVLAVAVVACALTGSSAFAAPGVSLGVMGGAGMSMPSTTGADGGIGLSLGATAGMGPLEASLLYSQYKIGATALGVEASTTTNFLDIPVLYRIDAGPLSVGVGGFYSLFLSGSTEAAGISTDITDGDSNYGATASVRFTLPVVGFFVDGRYNLGLKDNGGTKLSGAAVYVGWNFL